MADIFDTGPDPLARRRRGDSAPDPFSDAARFPTLVQRDQSALRDAQAGIQGAALGGRNSVAGRFDPLDKGSIFSRQFAGAADALRDAQRPAAALGPRPVSQSAELSSIDRYAVDTGYQTPADIAAQQGLNAIDRYAYDTNPAQRDSGEQFRRGRWRHSAPRLRVRR